MGALIYRPVAHLSAIAAQGIDITQRIPWLYIIAAIKQRILYVGETNDEGGLVARLSTHFGPYPRSGFRQCASRHGGVRRLEPPFLMFGARLPFDGEDAPFDGTSKKVRLKLETVLHELIARQFLAENRRWTLVSSSTPAGAVPNTYQDAVDSIYACFSSGFDSLETISVASPWNLILLDHTQLEDASTGPDVGALLEDIELSLFEWLLPALQQRYGDTWWSDGVPEGIRVACATRREKEGASERLPPEAYLMLIDFKDIGRKNWDICGPVLEKVAGACGKDRATSWLAELNEIRKLWAHPVKRMFDPVDQAKACRIRQLQGKIKQVVGSLG